MDRHIDELCKVKSAPQDAQRLEIPRCFLDEAGISGGKIGKQNPVSSQSLHAFEQRERV
jgi:hypothetical protein